MSKTEHIEHKIQYNMDEKGLRLISNLKIGIYFGFT